MIGVAISTTGQDHRMGFLETSVTGWHRVLDGRGLLIVTVDGSVAEAQKVADAVGDRALVYRVGQRPQVLEGRMGVAVNKNTGIEVLMDAYVSHLFLSDDDCSPLSDRALNLHGRGGAHSMVCWGPSRLAGTERTHATWSWPRGVMLYATHDVVKEVGGMDERFGIGGHEHAEWSRRIYQAGLTPQPFVSPPEYGAQNGRGARDFWHCEDMVKPGEAHGSLGSRRRRITSVDRSQRDWARIHAIMDERDGDTSFVSYHGVTNGRESATLFHRNVMSPGAGGSQ